MLRLGQPMATARLDDLEPGPEPGRIGRAERIHVDADPVADPSRPSAAGAQEDGDRRLGLARLDPRRQFQRLAPIAELDHVLVGDPQLVRQRLADEGRVVPGHPVHRLGQFLQPAVVGEPAVPDRRIGAEDQLQPLAGPLPAGRDRVRRGLDLAGLVRRALDHPLAQGGPPGRPRSRPAATADASSRAPSPAPTGRARPAGRPAARWPTCWRTAARSGAAGSSPCRRTSGRRPTTPARGTRGCASGRTRRSHPGGTRGGP